jgi:hypothetical protein
MIQRYHHLFCKGALLFSLLVLLPGAAWSWGWRGHRWVNQQAFGHLPEEMAGFKRWSRVVTVHGSDADQRKAWDPLESPRHWIDIDNFPEFHQGSLSHDLDSLKAKHGHRFDVYGNGVVPWVIAGVTESLTVAMAAGDWGEALLLAADLGHYVADCHQPLHTTENYNGQVTGNEGIHLRYEIEMVDRNFDQLQIDSAQAVYVQDPLEHIFGTIVGTWSYVDDIMAADHQARKQDLALSDDYYRILWDKTSSFTVKQLSQASRILADLWYTAWIDAGRPLFPCSTATVAIADVQADPRAHRLVAVEGVVTIGSGVLDSERTRVYLQDESGRGILVFDHDPTDGLRRGDRVRVEGTAQEYREITEITGPWVTVLDGGCSVPAPRMLSTGEVNHPQWDGTMVQVQGPVVFTLRDDGWTRLHLNDGTGALVILVFKDTGIDLSSVEAGDIMTVSGVGTYLADERSYAILPGYPDQVVLEESARDVR